MDCVTEKNIIIEKGNRKGTSEGDGDSSEPGGGGGGGFLRLGLMYRCSTRPALCRSPKSQ
jgi:hypothetical protein